MPITIEDSNGELYQIPTINSDNWKLSPPMYFFYWFPGSVTPAPVLQTIIYPKYDEIENFEDFTDWQFESIVVCTSAVPFVQIHGASSHVADLGLSEGLYYNRDIVLNFVYLNLLNLGQYHATVTYKVTAFNPNSGVRELISEKNMIIEFWCSDYSFLLNPPISAVYQDHIHTITSLGSPPALNFNYNRNGALPASEDIYFFVASGADVGWVASDDSPGQLGTIVNSHNFFSKVVVSIDSIASDLVAGQHLFYLTLYQFATPRLQIPIAINVFEAPVFPFSVVPDPIEFDIHMGVRIVEPIVVNIMSEEPWVIESILPNWLQVSSFNDSGDATVLFTIVNYRDLIAGVYNYNLVFFSNGERYTVPVVLKLKFFVVSPFIGNKLFFSESLDFLNFTSELQNTFIELEMQVKIFKLNTYEPIIYTRKYNIPLFKGKGDFHPGTAVHDLFEKVISLDEVVPVLDDSYSRTQYKPAEIAINYAEKDYPGVFHLEEYLAKGTIDKFRMVKGKKPFVTNSQMSLLTVGQQEFTRISPNSAVCVSFSNFDTPQILVKKNNVVIEDIIIPAFPEDYEEKKVLYSFFRFFKNLKAGDVIEIMILSGLASRTQRYLVFHPGKESTYFIYLNSNDLPEFIEFTGRRRISSGYNHKVNSKFDKLYSYDTKVDSSNVQSMIVNSGQMMPNDDIIIDSIIKSKNVWCSLNNSSGPYFRVDATTSKMQNEDTDSIEISFDVEFNFLENSNDILYPRQ